nr:reverse transcriptase domain-containing protein [Tanacetum cinerariifolium]
MGDLVSKFMKHCFPPSKTTHLKNEITRFTQKFKETFGEAWERFKEMLRQCPHHGFSELHQIDTFYNGLNEHEQDSLNATAGGDLLRKTPRDALTIIENKSKVRYSRNKPVAFKVSTTSSGNSSSTDARIDKLTDIISNLVETFNKKMTTPATVKVVKETCVICGGAYTYYDCIATDSNISSACATTAQTQVPIDEPAVAPKPKPTIPYPSRANKQKLRKKDDILALKFVEIFRNLHFELSFADALLYMPKFALMFKSLLNNKEKLFDLATTPVNENCSAIILKKLPEKLGDSGKKLSLPELISTQMILELADRSTTRLAGIAEDIFVKVGKFNFPTDFVVVDYVVVDYVVEPHVYGKELTLRVDDEAITFKVGQTSKYSYNDAESINRVDVIDVACEEGRSSSPLPPKELNVEEIKTVKSSIDEPPELELEELPSHLEYAFLEGIDKLPIIISKELKDEEKSALLK